MIALYFALEICTTLMVAHVHDWTRWLDFIAISISTCLLLLELRYETIDPERNMHKVSRRFDKRRKFR